ncbi:hypothetical protein MICRO11B_160056 [Micrococcus luteus]|nr:hypothetical protein MICRO11B_160056 [Micrococcus luteus]
MVPGPAAPALPRAAPDRRHHGDPRRPAGRDGVLRHRPADQAGEGPGRPRRRELPLLRGPDRGPARRHLQGAGPPDQLREPQADRRRRPDHPVEHPVHAGVLEAGPGHRHRQLGGAQARRVHPALGLPVGRDLRGGRPAEGRVQHGARLRRGGLRGRPAREAPGRAADLLHRRVPHRPDHLRQRRPAPEGPVHGARRQVPGRGVRGRGPGRGDRRDHLRRVLPERRALHRRLPHPGPAFRLRRVRGALRRPGLPREGRPAGRRDHRGRRHRAPGALREGHVLRGDRQDRGPPGGRRRPPGGLPRGQLRAAHRVRGRGPGRPDLPGGDLRPGGGHHPLRHGGGGPAAGQQHQVRPRGVHLDERPQARPQRRAERGGRHGVAELQQCAGPAHPVRRGEGLRPGPRGRLPLDRLLHRSAGRAHQPRRGPQPGVRQAGAGRGEDRRLTRTDRRPRRRPHLPHEGAGAVVVVGPGRASPPAHRRGLSCRGCGRPGPATTQPAFLDGLPAGRPDRIRSSH